MNYLDATLRALAATQPQTSGPLEGAADFMVGLKKFAMETPDTSGAVEGPFLVPLPQAVALMAQVAGNELKTHAYYLFYSNMLRGTSHEGLSEVFKEHAEHEKDHADYLLRRIGVLSPGGVSIPPFDPPVPMSEPADIINAMLVVEQQGLSLWKALHAIMGENPMKYTIEQYMQQEEEHSDELWQHTPAPAMPVTTPAPDAQAAIKMAAKKLKMAAEAKKVTVFPVIAKNKVLETNKTIELNSPTDQTIQTRKVEPEGLPGFVYKDEPMKAAHMTFKPSRKLLMQKILEKRAFGTTPSAEEYLANEQAAAVAQAVSEGAHAKTLAMQAGQAAQMAQAEAQAAQQQAQELQAKLEQSEAQAAENQQQALVATQQAAEAEGRAAEHSIAKMNLGMRVNQLRQQLAQLVTQDPVAETAASVSDLGAQGQPATPQQQQEAEAMQAEAQVPTSATTQEQAQEAQNAQANAELQTAQAQASAEQDAAKVSAAHHEELAKRVLSTAKVDADDYVPAITKALGEVAIKRKMEEKTASPADRRLARAILEMQDPLGHALSQNLKKMAPGTAGVAAADNAMKAVGDSVRREGKGLAEQLTPHAPGIAAGGLAGYVLGKGVGRNKAINEMQQPVYGEPQYV